MQSPMGGFSSMIPDISNLSKEKEFELMVTAIVTFVASHYGRMKVQHIRQAQSFWPEAEANIFGYVFDLYSDVTVSDDVIIAHVLRQFITWKRFEKKTLYDMKDYTDEKPDAIARLYFDRNFLKRKYLNKGPTQPCKDNDRKLNEV